jgi:integrase
MSPSRRRQGEGGITFLESKQLWRGSVELAPDPETGARRRKEFTGKVKSDVVKKLREYQRELDAGRTVVSSSPTVSTWLNHWMDHIVQVRPTTWESYRSSLAYAHKSLGKKKLERLTIDDIRRWHDDMSSGRVSGTGRPLSPTTQHTAHVVLAKALGDAMVEGRLGQNVCRMVKPPRRAVQPISVLTMQEVTAVVQAVTNDRLGSRWAAALLTGMRQGELIGLRWQDVDFDAGVIGDDLPSGTIDVAWQLQRITQYHGCATLADGGPSCGRVRASDCSAPTIKAPADWEHEHLVGGLYLGRPKTSTGWRVIPLVDPLLTILRQRYEASRLEPNPHGLVWTADRKRSRATGQLLPLDGSPIDPSDDSAAWHDALERAGVPQLRLHDARHTAITVLYDQKVPEASIQQIAGQSTVATTRGYKAKYSYQLVDAMRLLGGSGQPAQLPQNQTVLSITPRSPGQD